MHIDDPLERVRLTALATAIAKEEQRTARSRAVRPDDGATCRPLAAPPAFRWLGQRDAQNKLLNVAVSNVPGPRERGHFGGAPVSEIYSVGPLIAGCGINITVWSYVDQLDISVLADDRTLDDTHEVDRRHGPRFRRNPHCGRLSRRAGHG